jgi:hypothetical protein
LFEHTTFVGAVGVGSEHGDAVWFATGVGREATGTMPLKLLFFCFTGRRGILGVLVKKAFFPLCTAQDGLH